MTQSKLAELFIERLKIRGIMKDCSNQKKSQEFPQTQCPHMMAMMQCMTVCMACAKRCIEEGNKDSAKICLECAEMCALAIKSHSADFEMDSQIMELCAKTCERCSEICSRMDAQHCQECADICRQCAEACSSMCQSR